MTWITRLPLITSMCIGGALIALGSPYLGALLALTATVIFASQKIIRHCQKRMISSGKPQQATMHFENPMRHSAIFIVGVASGAAIVLLFTVSGLVPNISSAFAQPASQTSEEYHALKLFGKVFDVVRADYVEKPNDKKLIESAIKGMVTGLDPHSSYIDAKNLKNMEADINGQFGGLGMELTIDKDGAKVISLFDNSPASRAGITAGDIITKVDGDPIKGMPLDLVVAKLRGRTGSRVTLEIARKSQPNPIQVTLVRENIEVRPVRHRVEGNDVGYIRVLVFNALTDEELKAAIKDISGKIPERKLKGYILDLRNDPGGLLDQAALVSDAFLAHGEIVSLRGRKPDESQRFDATAGDLTHGKPLIVLINGGSASASEIVAGALQDQKRATIVGTRSFGKGSVQTIIPLGSGNGALRLTTAKYFTPSGRSIQAQGITPDIEVKQEAPKDSKIQTNFASEATLAGHLKSQGPEHKGSQSYVPSNTKDDRALQTALALLRGTEVNPAFPPKLRQAHAS